MLVLIKRILMPAALSLALLACGGGTTGTSPTVVKLSGTARDQNGAGISDTSMTVLSAPSGEVLVASSTDSVGSFDMTLPSSETTLDISLEGATPLAFRRSITESSAAFVSLAVDSSSKESFLASQVEARVVGSSCQNITSTPFSVDATAVADVQSTCEVQIQVSTGEVNTAASVVAVSGQCEPGGGRTDLAVTESNGQETVSIDIAPALRSNCATLLIEVRPSAEQVRGIQFELTR